MSVTEAAPATIETRLSTQALMTRLHCGSSQNHLNSDVGSFAVVQQIRNSPRGGRVEEDNRHCHKDTRAQLHHVCPHNLVLIPNNHSVKALRDACQDLRWESVR